MSYPTLSYPIFSVQQARRFKKSEAGGEEATCGDVGGDGDGDVNANPPPTEQSADNHERHGKGGWAKKKWRAVSTSGGVFVFLTLKLVPSLGSEGTDGGGGGGVSLFSVALELVPSLCSERTGGPRIYSRRAFANDRTL